jgi:glycerol-3-phosphate cytidylyltransferase
MLRNARSRCDKLIVGVAADETVALHKKKIPIVVEEERLAIIKAIKYVDDAFIYTNYASVLDDIKMLKMMGTPMDLFFCGDDWVGGSTIAQQDKECEQNGAKRVWLPYTKIVSTTKIIDKIAIIKTNRK